jgi:hypothetical protein
MSEPTFDMANVKTFYATIARNQIYNQKFGPGCVRINADNETHARELIRNATDNKWSMMYDSLDKVHELDRTILGTLGYLI